MKQLGVKYFGFRKHIRPSHLFSIYSKAKERGVAMLIPSLFLTFINVILIVFSTILFLSQNQPKKY